MFLQPGFRVDEIDPWEEAGEQWRRLKVVFPKNIVAHAPEQFYSINRDGLLRRFDYRPKLEGVPAKVNYAADHERFGELVTPTRRRMLPGESDGRSRSEPVLMSIEVRGCERGAMTEWSLNEFAVRGAAD